MFLKNIDENDQSRVFTEDQLIQTCADLAMAGSDTTGNSIEYAILYMLQFPHEQRAVQKEIDSVIGHHRKPTIDDRNKMPYTEATILEILRCANVIAFDYRTALRDTQLCGATVPKVCYLLKNHHLWFISVM
jgi:cytochrome P450